MLDRVPHSVSPLREGEQGMHLSPVVERRARPPQTEEIDVAFKKKASKEGKLPAPLTPSECDLRDFPFLPIEITRLFGSDFHTLSSDAEWRAGVTLWLKSFHQVPSASLPCNDRSLAHLAEFGRDIESWLQVRNGALHGWILCADGRLYHPVVAVRAREAWRRKLIQREKGRKGNAVRWKKPLPDTLAQTESTLNGKAQAYREVSNYHRGEEKIMVPILEGEHGFAGEQIGLLPFCPHGDRPVIARESLRESTRERKGE
ncbi:hypothetical protein [Entomobacter blattae]|uniref:DUF1376 domain-containing protein n=1 Tax=Entomobacter blattae TaxID=2762277 RepID=A0A7H1NR51_9PROT|nr:hypothetical protein [Entomobacter blattae]QNT78261.1 hypothetical protein JGUZn3_10330 [Entomobacter blattae]